MAGKGQLHQFLSLGLFQDCPGLGGGEWKGIVLTQPGGLLGLQKFRKVKCQLQRVSEPGDLAPASVPSCGVTFNKIPGQHLNLYLQKAGNYSCPGEAMWSAWATLTSHSPRPLLCQQLGLFSGVTVAPWTLEGDSTWTQTL